MTLRSFIWAYRQLLVDGCLHIVSQDNAGLIQRLEKFIASGRFTTGQASEYLRYVKSLRRHDPEATPLDPIEYFIEKISD